ncbi:hypothetical protein J2Z60_000921 [Lactobacillus colini]|uniref:NusG domain-containing protein n=1 Tax=Lactobacillus colini TaxID=1819254 RepID=A0ABS4MDK8_9LACO|nr:NusG domain II-containing protein [Lactobacillus colini]MBP2057749.1 hypothetical protein [Lactobacillus colini]
MKQKIKIGDILVAALLLILSFIPFYFLKNHNKTNNSQIIAVIKVNNHQIKEIPLNQDTTWTYSKNGHSNTLQVKNNKIRMLEANCKDQVCVREGWKKAAGQTIVCLPHKFLVEIKQTNPTHKNKKMNFDHTLVNP